jgi:Fe-S cluster assembly scaffold protein SufB
MSETQTTTPAIRHMREERKPFLPADLEEAALRRIAYGPASLSRLRAAALEALRKIGLPQSGSEDYTFIRIGEVVPRLSEIPPVSQDPEDGRMHPAQKTSTLPTLEAIRALVFPESRESYLILLDGEYAPGLSHPGKSFRIASLESSLGRDAAGISSTAAGKSKTTATATATANPAPAASAETGTGRLEDALTAALSRETDAAALLAALFAHQPLHIQVDAKAIPASPLQVIHLRTQADARRRDTFLALSAGRLSESRVLVRHADFVIGNPMPQGAGSMANILSLALLDEGASLKWFETAPEGAATAGDLHFHKLSVSLERDSRLFAMAASTGSRLTRHAYAVDLRGQGADAEINGAAVLADNRQSHAFAQVRHLAPNCASRQHFKTVAADRSRASVDGTIFVAEGAQQTNANQLINNLMLSDEARADSKPRLLIHADDVKCSHGATAGKLDPDQLFYLESRGLPPAQARTLMTLAFIAEVLERAEKAEGAGTGGSAGASGFRAHLDATLLATLKGRLEAASPTAKAADAATPTAAAPGGQAGPIAPPDSPKGT